MKLSSPLPLRLQQRLLDHVAKDAGGRWEASQPEAKDLLRQVDDAAKPRVVKEVVPAHRPTPRHPAVGAHDERKQAGKEQRDASWDRTRDAVRARVKAERHGRCEWACERPADDPHHIIGGKNRKQFEAPETVAGVCRDHHRLYEKDDPDTLQRALAWAAAHGFHVARRAIVRRIERVAETAALLARHHHPENA